ncbi:MAG: serine/threonine-protein kinase PknD [Chlamydiales bacterium]|nr:serine/threonine-protein kinase PknD [Chlamydiia bacterium]MCP5506690.1 serine/threonine-protein kinase PknD [Chlamydiales bacterium]
MDESSKDVSQTEGSRSLVEGHLPEHEAIKFSIGPYQVLDTIGKGGMGQVFLAYDTTCGRRIALKRIRDDLVEYEQMHNRFLKEAHVTCQLTHPAIIPIYSIHHEEKYIYYTMPYVQGDTLKQIIRATRKTEKEGGKTEHGEGSIPALVRTFLQVCHAVAYAHSKGVLHRDIKPENIIVGKYGEVMILDWGLAKLIETRDNEEAVPAPKTSLSGLTVTGKVVGTVTYMAPERGIGHPATVLTDIYSLGVILYQILTLRPPFKRGSLKEFRQKMSKEELPDPAKVAPYRDVPRILGGIATKCLEFEPQDRYQTVQELIHDVESYIEGRAEWFHNAELDIYNKSDWEFQEHVLIAEHVAITRGAEAADWMNLMISKVSFSENIRIEADITLGNRSKGIGFLLSVPEPDEREQINDGYCLWLGSDADRTTRLLRSSVEVVHADNIYLEHGRSYRVRIDKLDNNIYVYLDNVLYLSYISHLPYVGTHVGLLSRDVDFTLENFNIFTAGQNVTVSCLAVPDAFLAHKEYHIALSEYRRIGYSFPGRAEGREAQFRAGVTLLEQARNTRDTTEAETLYDLALEEFGKLHSTPGAPLEYLGKALVYRALKDYDEEIKCFELAYRRYPHHPLLPVLEEQVLYRMHESAHINRKATYAFVLLVLRHVKGVARNKHARKLFRSIKKHWEPLYFIEEDPKEKTSAMLKASSFAMQLAFWLGKPYVIEEIIDEIVDSATPSVPSLCNALFCLLTLGCNRLAVRKYSEIRNKASPDDPRWLMIKIAIDGNTEELKKAMAKISDLNLYQERTLLFILDQDLTVNNTAGVYPLISTLGQLKLTKEQQLRLDYRCLWAHLLDHQWREAGAILNNYSVESLNRENTALHYLYGIWLNATEGQELAMIHFSSVLDVAYPRSWTLLSHYLKGRIPDQSPWYNRAFPWERRQMYRQLSLYYLTSDDYEKAQYYKDCEKNELLATYD